MQPLQALLGPFTPHSLRPSSFPFPIDPATTRSTSRKAQKKAQSKRNVAPAKETATLHHDVAQTLAFGDFDSVPGRLRNDKRYSTLTFADGKRIMDPIQHEKELHRCTLDAFLWTSLETAQVCARGARAFAAYCTAFSTNSSPGGGLINSDFSLNLVFAWERYEDEMAENLVLSALINLEAQSTGLSRAAIPDATVEALVKGGLYERLLAYFLDVGLAPQSKWNRSTREFPSATFDLQDQLNLRHDSLLFITEYITGAILRIFLKAPVDRNPSLKTIISGAEWRPLLDKPRLNDSNARSGALLLPTLDPRVELARAYGRREPRSKRETDPTAAERCQACERALWEIPEFAGTKKTFSYCGRCEGREWKMAYCSRDCQVQHWPSHKDRCSGKPLNETIPTPEFHPHGPPPPRFSPRLQHLKAKHTAPAFYHFLPVCMTGIPAVGPRSLDVKPIGIDGAPNAQERWEHGIDLLKELVDAGEDVGKTQRPQLFSFFCLCAKSNGWTADGDDAISLAGLTMQISNDFGVHQDVLLFEAAKTAEWKSVERGFKDVKAKKEAAKQQ